MFNTSTLSRKIKQDFLDTSLPLKLTMTMVGLGLGVLLASSISGQTWPAVFAIILAIPAAMLLSNYPFAGVLIWIVVTPLFVVGNDTDLYVYWILHRAVIPFALIMVLLPYLFRLRDAWPVRLGLAELAMMAFLGFVLLSVFLLSFRSRSALFRAYDRYFIAYCLYLLIRFSDLKKRELMLLVGAAAIQLLIQAGVGLLANFAPNLLPFKWTGSRTAERTVGTFNNTARYTSTLVFSMVLIYQAAMTRRRDKARIFLLFLFVLGAFMVFMSFSKGSWLAGIIVLMGIMLLYPGPMVRTLVAIAIFMGVFGTGLLAVQLEQASSRLEDESGNERMTANAAMLNMLEASPLYGWGYGNLDNLISDYVVSVDGFYARQSASHNTSLALLAELGGLGFLLYYFPAFYWLKLTINAWPCMPRAGFASRVLVALLWLSILFHFVVGNFSDFRTGPSGVFSTTLWWLTLGLIAYLVYPSTQSELVPDTEKMGHDAGPKFSNRLI